MCNSFSARGLFFIASRVLSLQLNMFQSSGLPSDLRALPQIKKANATSSFSLLLKRFLNAVNEIFRIARSNSWRWNFRWTKQFFLFASLLTRLLNVFRTGNCGFLSFRLVCGCFIISHFWSDDSPQSVLCAKRSQIKTLSPFYRSSRRFSQLFGDHLFCLALIFIKIITATGRRSCNYSLLTRPAVVNRTH